MHTIEYYILRFTGNERTARDVHKPSSALQLNCHDQTDTDPSAVGTPLEGVDFSPKRLTQPKIFRAHILLTNLLVNRDGLVAAYRIPFITSSLAGNLLHVVANGIAIYPVALA